MSLLYTVLFWFTVVTTFMSGGLGFLLKLPQFYHPDAYLIGKHDGLEVGTGTTPFEVLSAYVCGIIYVGPLVGMIYAHIEGTVAAKRAAVLMPIVYHTASVVGVRFVFQKALNPLVAPLNAAVAMHAVYALLFVLLFWSAEDTKAKIQ